MAADQSTFSPSICVLLATFNGEKYICEQIDSIISQLRDGDQILVADDGSRDNTVRIVTGYRKYVRVVATDRVGGVVKNFERLLGHVDGEIVVLCDQDDVWLPGRVEVIRRSMETSCLLLMNAYVVDSMLRRTNKLLFDSIVFRRSVLLQILLRNPFVGCCMAFRASLCKDVLPFPRSTVWHDWLIGLVASCSEAVTFYEHPTLLFRRHQTNATSTGVRTENSICKIFYIRVCMTLALLHVLIRRQLRRVWAMFSLKFGGIYVEK